MFKKLSDSLPNMGQHARPDFKSSKSGRKKQVASEVFDFLELIERWEEIVGPKLSKVTVPLKNQNQTLTILTNHSAYSQALSYMEDTLKKKLFNAFPLLKTKIKKFNFQVSTAHFDKMKADLEKRANIGKKSVVQQKQQTTFHPQNPQYKKMKAQAEAEFSFIDDEEIRQKMVSIFLQNEVKNQSK